MKITFDINDKFVLKELKSQRLEDEKMPTLKSVKSNKLIKKYLAEVAQGLLEDHLERGKDEGDLGSLFYTGDLER